VAPDRWAGALAGVDTVVHLAAATGKSTREELFAVNGVATSELVARARDAGVRRFILVSSIAAAFGDRRYYPYAESKLAAEGAVLASGIDVLIVRPTVVLGRGSPTARSLRALAAGPVAVCFGSGQVVTRPIHVSDLARVLVEAVSLPELGNRIVEVGGPETISMERLLRRIREVVRGRTGPLVKIPIVPLRQVLAFVEPVLRPILPFTAGQLASFVNDGRPRQPWPTPFSSPSTGLDVMLSREELGG
jgi:nucleoside-diphosphate-sugar epimerase